MELAVKVTVKLTEMRVKKMRVKITVKEITLIGVKRSTTGHIKRIITRISLTLDKNFDFLTKIVLTTIKVTLKVALKVK